MRRGFFVMTQVTIRRAFSLIELMVVILILAVVVAIIVPALGGARNAAKGVSTRATLTQVANAASAFSNDHQERMPGHFTAEEMGDQQNSDRGFAEMENVLLELAGGMVDRDPGPSMGTSFGGSGDRIEVGPMSGAENTVLVDVSLIGADSTRSGAYFTPDTKLYRTGNGQATSVTEHEEDLPDLLDAWGTPILAWRRNEFGPTRISDVQDFALEASPGSGSGDRAWYYWNANAGFLNGEAVGRLTTSQTKMSMIGGDINKANKETSLMGFLGSPAYPDDLSKSSHEDVRPAAARGELVLHSAGPSGVFLHNDSNGSKQFRDETIDYYRNFFNASGQPLTGDGGESETRDLLRAFDDLIQTGN